MAVVDTLQRCYSWNVLQSDISYSLQPALAMMIYDNLSVVLEWVTKHRYTT